MTKFKKVIAKNGRQLYWANGKMISADNISADILHRLETELEFEVDSGVQEKPVFTINTKKCIFDGEPATKQKFLNGITIGLCKADYDTKTSGKIAQRINEISTNT